MTTRTYTLYRFDIPEDAMHLVALTVDHTLADSRVAYRCESSTPGRDAKLLPASSDSAWYEFRAEYGWTEDEVRSIIATIDAAREALAAMADVKLDDTLKTLARDRRQLMLLRLAWERLLTTPA